MSQHITTPFSEKHHFLWIRWSEVRVGVRVCTEDQSVPRVGSKQMFVVHCLLTRGVRLYTSNSLYYHVLAHISIINTHIFV